MHHEAPLAKANEIAGSVLAPAARQNDKEGRFSSDAVDALGRAGLLGLTLPAERGGSGLGPRSFAAVTAALAEADASVAMVYLMHVCAVAAILAARPGAALGQTLQRPAARCADLLIARYRCSGRGDLRCPCLANTAACG